ncbi:hypothetical protein ARMSODRAFT_950962 [Armillaria solidipes]|uniref:Uncharacterized protein n=1 Tax=Armillaria solidipes TaxID=1076256 RepID=A0A2H3C9B8_9AGAR|nr:hypothetical protein ARMSODRAFT_950962 [Armillaria solidipes]
MTIHLNPSLKLFACAALSGNTNTALGTHVDGSDRLESKFNDSAEVVRLDSDRTESERTELDRGESDTTVDDAEDV